MRIVVFGQNGQVATELQRLAGAVGASLMVLGREAADLSQPEAAARTLRGLARSADAVINAAAYTAVDKAESEPDLAHAINGVAPGALAAAAADAGVPFLHISTDYVFDGSGKTPWKPDDATGPLGVYGASKLAGEKAVGAVGGPHAILRTSWVFSAHGANFVRTMLRLGAERDALNIVGDQVGGPTSARSIAAALFGIAGGLIEDEKAGGTYHFSGAGDVSWADFARGIFDQAEMSVDVTDIATSEYPTPAKRPPNSRLDCTTLAQTFGITRPDWQDDLATVLRQLGQTV